MADQSKAPAYRWTIEVLLIFALLSQNITWLAPAPILKPIIDDLHIGLGNAGLIISIIALCIAIFSLAGALVAARLGALRALIVGIWLMALGAILSGYAPSFGLLLTCRVLEGIGFGLMMAPPGTLVMEWFPEAEWPYINMINALCAYIALTFVFSVTPMVFHGFGSSWRPVLLVYGIGVAAIAMAWTLLGRERHARAARAAAEGAPGALSASLLEVVRMRGVVLVAIGLFGGMSCFQLFTAFLPQFFQTYRGLGLADASSLTAILPLAGVFAAAGGGVATGAIGLRKPFTWPLAIVFLAGCLGAVTIPSLAVMRLSMILIGIGAAGGLTALVTILMELPGMTPAKTGSGIAVIWAAGFAGAFLSPAVGGAIAGAIGLQAVMLASLSLQILPLVAWYLVPETGPGRPRIAIAAASAR